MPDDNFVCVLCGRCLVWISWLGGYWCINPNCDQEDLSLFNDELDELED